MAQGVSCGHEALVHDAAYDACGRHLATCSSDTTITVFDITGEKYDRIAVIRGHSGPVWRVAWAHPRFGCMLASASHDGHATVWQRQQLEGCDADTFVKVHDFTEHSGSVNCVDWAPPEAGILLATASSDGRAAVLRNRGECGRGAMWSADWLPGREGAADVIHQGGVLAVAFAPPPPGAGGAAPRLATAGADGRVRLWRQGADGSWGPSQHAPQPAGGPYPGPVCDVRFCAAPDGLLLACCSGSSAWVWRQQHAASASAEGRWEELAELGLGCSTYRVAWQEGGAMLAVTAASRKVTVFAPSDGAPGQQTKWEVLPVAG
eukprot:TRINITY_DN32765_c0_g1_i1.p1 TRINITY_DN32765_c0_g1~~TRINITY_DN32765_c0_g1_i1.p1  ORF type:complete len:344 (+),score=94.91 TRINITY_DN32765_c0_g1_i1:74-1033(+)